MNYKIGDKISLDQALKFSLELASKGLGFVEPNPCVGSVLIDENTDGELNALVSFGYHQKYGGPHAEVNCLKNIKTAKGLTLIVTLEPCFHQGKTPPCADLVIDKKPKKLIYITKDPNPLVAGKGLIKIKEAGIEVVAATGIEYALENKRLNHKFFYSFENKKSYIHLKWAESADGKTAVKEGSPWITGEKSREHSHFLRAQSQAVLIGRGTLEADDPSLNVRKKGYERLLKVIVFDPDLKTFENIESKNIFKIRSSSDIIFLCQKIPENKKGCSFLELKRNSSGEWDLNQLAEDLYKDFGFQAVFVEGGAYTISQFIKQDAYNRASIYKGPDDLGQRGVSPVISFSKEKKESAFSILEDTLLIDILVDLFFD